MTQLLVDRIALDGSVGSVGSAAARAGVVTAAPGRVAPGGPLPSRRLRPGRPGRGPGRAASPTLRPAVFWPTPSVARRTGPRAHSCSMPESQLSSPTMSAPVWRLTDRGIAVLLVSGLMIMVAALTVVGLTAVTVTGEGYRATVSSSLPR